MAHFERKSSNEHQPFGSDSSSFVYIYNSYIHFLMIIIEMSHA